MESELFFPICYLAADTGGVNSWVVREYMLLD